MGQLNESQIIHLYTKELWTLRMVADHLNTNHHTIRRILNKNGIAISAKQRRKPFSDEHRERISESRKKLKGKGWIPYNLGIKMPELANRKNMLAKLSRPTLTLEILNKYEDFEKLKFLNGVIARHRREFQSDEKYIAYLDKFYFDETFNRLYDNWLKSEKNKWYMPSIDHINPKSKGGVCDLDNIQFLTLFENRAKAEMSQQEWEDFKKQTNTKSDLFNEVSY